jgi:hypothetical protein
MKTLTEKNRSVDEFAAMMKERLQTKFGLDQQSMDVPNQEWLLHKPTCAFCNAVGELMTHGNSPAENKPYRHHIQGHVVPVRVQLRMADLAIYAMLAAQTFGPDNAR